MTGEKKPNMSKLPWVEIIVNVEIISVGIRPIELPLKIKLPITITRGEHALTVYT